LEPGFRLVSFSGKGLGQCPTVRLQESRHTLSWSNLRCIRPKAFLDPFQKIAAAVASHSPKCKVNAVDCVEQPDGLLSYMLIKIRTLDLSMFERAKAKPSKAANNAGCEPPQPPLPNIDFVRFFLRRG